MSFCPRCCVPRGRSNLNAERAALQARASDWRVGARVPPGVADVLRVSRELYLRSCEVYEFALVSLTWALLALEASLRTIVPASDKASLQHLIERATAAGLLDPEESVSLHGARELRNTIVHGSLLPSFRPQAAEVALSAIHEAISDLHDRAPSASAPARRDTSPA